MKGLPWLQILIKEALKGKLRFSAPSVTTKMVCVLDEEAVQIGRNIIPALKARKTAEAGVNQWRQANQAINELFELYPWIESTFIILGKGVVKTASWGVMWRVSISAIFSIADLGTDCLVGYEYYHTDRMDYFMYTVSSIATCMFFQLILVVVQYSKKGFGRILREAVFVVTGMKAPRDAFKVASGHMKEEDTLVDPMMEYIGAKCIDLFAESIPGVIIQLSAILTHGRAISTMQVISVLTSALTSGFTAAQISYDFDTDPYARRAKPDFYGYVPDKSNKRSFLFIVMILMSATNLLCRAQTIVLLVLSKSWYVLGFLSFDLTVFLLLKVVRDDFIYWAPLEGFKKYTVSLLMRVMIKIVTDFTGVIQFRHPNEVGGLQWTLGYFSSILFLIVATAVYENVVGPKDGIWEIGGLIAVLSVSFFFVFLNSIKRKYIRTFLSIETGGQLTMRQFMESDHDGIKAGAVFQCSEHTWRKIRPGVKLWVKTNYDDWIEQRPPWFTDEMRAKIPSDMIPSNMDRQRMKSLARLYDSSAIDMKRMVAQARRNSDFGLTVGGLGNMLAKVADASELEEGGDEEGDLLLSEKVDYMSIFRSKSGRFM